MNQENTYVRSTPTSDTMEQNNNNRSGANRGTYEWVKFAVFFAGIILITAIIITLIAPLLFRDYIPGILGLPNEPAGVMIEEIDDSALDNSALTEEAEVEPALIDETETTETEESFIPIVGSEAETLPAEESASSKVDEAESDFELYVVKPGESLTTIAAAHDLTVNEIVAANALLNPNLLYAGQEIKIPQK